jgi:inosine-uridine nucleoside N-ribohydrolase
MLRTILLSLAFTSLAFAQSTRPADLAGQKPVKLIFDCDMDSDCDDAGALGILHALADRDEVEPLAVMLSARNPDAPACVAAINRYYGRELPIGIPGPHAPLQKSKYTTTVAKTLPEGTDIAKHDAVALYRQILKKADDASITIVTVGDLSNLAPMMEDPQMTALVKQKVKLYVCMGGNFIGNPAKDDLKLGNNNFTIDAKSTYTAITHWPTPIVFAGREMCSVPSGLKVGKRLAETPKENPVRIAYEAYFDGQPKDRHVADLATVVFAVRGLGNNWGAEQAGAMELARDMTFTWNYENPRPMAYLLKKKPDREVEKVIEELLVAAPKGR